eukprot:gene4405-4451_t
MPAASACDLIYRLGLAPHPEGGWFRQTWCAPAPEGQRPAGTLIHFLLETGQRSHWHRVDAEELWLWQGGDPIDLAISANDAGPVSTLRLGPDPLSGDLLQGMVPTGHWQAATPCGGEHGYVLVSCAVMPGFTFDGFELAAEGWAPGG